jgi:hypothetical protein
VLLLSTLFSFSLSLSHFLLLLLLPLLLVVVSFSFFPYYYHIFKFFRPPTSLLNRPPHPFLSLLLTLCILLPPPPPCGPFFLYFLIVGSFLFLPEPSNRRCIQHQVRCLSSNSFMLVKVHHHLEFNSPCLLETYHRLAGG